MTDTTDDIAEEISFQSFDDDCKLLGNLLNDILQREVGTAFVEKLEKIRILAQVIISFLYIVQIMLLNSAFIFKYVNITKMCNVIAFWDIGCYQGWKFLNSWLCFFHQSACNMRQAGIEEMAEILEKQLASELSKMTLEEAQTLARAFSHYLTLMGIAETHHR